MLSLARARLDLGLFSSDDDRQGMDLIFLFSAPTTIPLVSRNYLHNYHAPNQTTTLTTTTTTWICARTAISRLANLGPTQLTYVIRMGTSLVNVYTTHAWQSSVGLSALRNLVPPFVSVPSLHRASAGFPTPDQIRTEKRLKQLLPSTTTS